jgi:hypothetical protein
VVISSLFVAASRWLIEGTNKFCRLIPARRELADRMEVLREQLDLTRRWKPLGEYADVIEELQERHWMKVAAIRPRDEVLSVRITLEAQTLRDDAGS